MANYSLDESLRLAREQLRAASLPDGPVYSWLDSLDKEPEPMNHKTTQSDINTALGGLNEGYGICQHYPAKNVIVSMWAELQVLRAFRAEKSEDNDALSIATSAVMGRLNARISAGKEHAARNEVRTALTPFFIRDLSATHGKPEDKSTAKESAPTYEHTIGAAMIGDAIPDDWHKAVYEHICLLPVKSEREVRFGSFIFALNALRNHLIKNNPSKVEAE